MASIVLVVVFKLPLAAAMVIDRGRHVPVLPLLRPARSWTTLRESISLNVMLMVIGIMVFKGMLDASGAIEALARLLPRERPADRCSSSSRSPSSWAS